MYSLVFLLCANYATCTTVAYEFPLTSKEACISQAEDLKRGARDNNLIPDHKVFYQCIYWGEDA